MNKPTELKSMNKFTKIFYYLDYFWNYIVALAKIIMVIMLSGMVIVTFYQIINRYIIGGQVRWTAEMARYLMIWIVFLGSWYVYRKGEHLGIGFLTQRLSHKLQLFIGITVDLIIMIFIIVILIHTPKMLRITWRQLSATLKIPMGLVYLAFPLSSFMMLIDIILGWFSPLRYSPGIINVKKGELAKELKDTSKDMEEMEQ